MINDILMFILNVINILILNGKKIMTKIYFRIKDIFFLFLYYVYFSEVLNWIWAVINTLIK
jgi:hypothetical protein